MKINILNPRITEYSLMPHVVECKREFDYTLNGVGIEAALTPNAEYTVRIIPQEENATARTLRNGDEGCYEEIKCISDEKGVLHFSLALSREQIYTFRLLNGKNERLNDCKVYCAEKDLWERTPMRGNTHCHVCFSVDGHEDPIIAASVYRKAGFDYLAITDHHKIDGSLYAVEKMKDITTEMSLYYGEEVHVPDAYIHAVNVGALLEGNVGLDKWYHEHEDEVNEIVRKTAEEYKNRLPEDIEPYDFAWRKWIADTIHKNGGIAVVAHPFWEYDANNMRNSMFKYIAKTGLFDAAEIIHGQDDPDSVEANRQLAFWNDMRAEGVFIAPVGVDDAHRRNYRWNYGCDFNKAYTVIFAKDPSFEGFKEAIRGGYSAAVESYGNAPEHVVATYRLTNFTQFLLQEYYPFHDELCFEEGCRIKDAYLGDEYSLEVLKLLNGRVKKFTDMFFGR